MPTLLTDEKLLFWHFAWLAMTAIVACGLLAWRAIRQGRIPEHRKWMHRSLFFVGLFVALYVLKVVLLGKEDLSLWSHQQVLWLRLHESFVTLMLLAGTLARVLGNRARSTPGGRVAVRHRWLGRAAISFAVLAYATGTWILVILRSVAARAS